MLSLDIIVPAFNASRSIESTLNAIFSMPLPGTVKLGVIVVDNRSTDDTVERVRRCRLRSVRLVDFSNAQGRAPSINAGVAASSADYVMILDADCSLIGDDTFNRLAGKMKIGMVAGFGYTTSSAPDFWGAYHRSLEARRSEAGWQGWTTACCVLRRDVFSKVGGFSEAYRHYGFEDRDFVCRLRDVDDGSNLISLPWLQASHDDQLSVRKVCEKMYASGRYSSRVFMNAFPEAYRQTVYRRIDHEFAGLPMRLCLRSLALVNPLMIRLAEQAVGRRWVPFKYRGTMVKICSAVSFSRGSYLRDKE